ncbi:MAG: ligase-associated DNA damage response endonuclease PdeM [Pseudomonadota bacterium]
MLDPRPQASPQPDSAEPIRLGDLHLEPDLSGALWVPEERTLLVADLHFEKGSAFAARGVHLPPYDTGSTLGLLERAIARYRPGQVVSLGDSFHDDASRQRMSEGDAERIRAITRSVDFTWITGNHDTAPPDDLGGKITQTVNLAGIELRHEPTSGFGFHGEIAGHLHPVAAVVRRGRRLRRRCFVSDGTRLVMPAFGAYTGGLNVRSEPFAPVFPSGKFWAWLLGRDSIYRIHSRHLRG